MSGHTDDVLVHDGVRQGDIAFVQKPFTRDSLLRAGRGSALPLGAFLRLVARSAAGRGRPAHDLDRLSKSLEWSDSYRHDSIPAAGFLPTS
jgi:hypothetical protein